MNYIQIYLKRSKIAYGHNLCSKFFFLVLNIEVFQIKFFLKIKSLKKKKIMQFWIKFNNMFDKSFKFIYIIRDVTGIIIICGYLQFRIYWKERHCTGNNDKIMGSPIIISEKRIYMHSTKILFNQLSYY